jgi:phage baseplate assembly protein W
MPFKTSTSLGSDVLVFPGLDETFTLVSDSRVLTEALARRLCTPRGTLPFHPDYGLDLRQYLNQSMTADALYRLKTAAERECEQDERVGSADAVVTYTPSSSSLKVSLTINTAAGPFRLVLSVTQVSVDLLSEE